MYLSMLQLFLRFYLSRLFSRVWWMLCVNVKWMRRRFRGLLPDFSSQDRTCVLIEAVSQVSLYFFHDGMTFRCSITGNRELDFVLWFSVYIITTCAVNSGRPLRRNFEQFWRRDAVAAVQVMFVAKLSINLDYVVVYIIVKSFRPGDFCT